MNSNDNIIITRWHFAHLTIGYAAVITFATLLLMAGDSLIGFSLKGVLSFWVVAVAAVWMACEKVPSSTSATIQHRPDCQHYTGPSEPASATYQESHNCGHAKCPHYGFHHPTCPYYRKHFHQ